MRLKSHCQTLECLTHLMQSQRLWWKKIVENRFEIKQLELLRDALLPKLMSGELDVSNIQL